MFTVNDHPSGAKVYIFNLRTFTESDYKAIKEVLLAPLFVPWMKLPTDHITIIRDAFTEPLNVSLKGPGRMSLHLFGKNNWIVYNFNNESVECDLLLSEVQDKTFKNQVTGETITPNDDVLNLSIDKRNMVWVTTQ